MDPLLDLHFAKAMQVKFPLLITELDMTELGRKLSSLINQFRHEEKQLNHKVLFLKTAEPRAKTEQFKPPLLCMCLLSV